jgi:hypothetical protein
LIMEAKTKSCKVKQKTNARNKSSIIHLLIDSQKTIQKK